MKAWSHSALTKFETCPRQYHEMNVLKNYQDGSSEAMSWGNEVHKAFENYVRSGTPFPIGMRQFEKLVKPFVDAPGSILVEQKLAVTKEFAPTTWFGKNVWVRSIIDLAVVNGPKCIIVDWKTGKKKPNHDQLALMAAVMFAQAEELEQISAMFIWTQEDGMDAITRVTYVRSQLPKLWDRFLKREQVYQDAHIETNFPPKPSGLCRRFCPVASCEFQGG